MERYAVPIVLAAVLLSAGLFGFRREKAGENSEETGILETQLDKYLGDLASRHIPARSQAVWLVIGDAGAVSARLVQPLSAGQRLADWLSRAFGNRPPTAPVDSNFVRAFSDPQVIAWTHERFAACSKARMAAEFRRALLKAHDAGLEVDVLTQGVSALPMMLAIKSLDGTVRGGERVGVNRFIAVGMNAGTLSLLDPEDFANFKRPDNLVEWVPVWHKPVMPPQTIVEIYDAGREAEWFVAQELIEGGEDPVTTARWIKSFPPGVRERLLETAKRAAAARAPVRPAPPPTGDNFLPTYGSAEIGGRSQEREPLKTFAPSRSETNCSTSRSDCAAVCPGKCERDTCLCPENRGHCGGEFAKEEDCRYACPGRCQLNGMSQFRCVCADDPHACRETFGSQGECAYSCPARCAAGENGRYDCLCVANRRECGLSFGSMAGCRAGCPGQCAQRSPNEIVFDCTCR